MAAMGMTGKGDGGKVFYDPFYWPRYPHNSYSGIPLYGVNRGERHGPYRHQMDDFYVYSHVHFSKSTTFKSPPPMEKTSKGLENQLIVEPATVE
ncbi:hypothetical protein SUGI_0134900 [Cryptomeria japonica]|nr:hypothetical protein SUGI_0134900 [Cryptomeria japonica]